MSTNNPKSYMKSSGWGFSGPKGFPGSSKTHRHHHSGRTKNSRNGGEKDARGSTKQIFVGGCHPKIQQADLKGYFSKFGKVTECRLIKDKQTKKFRGFAFVTFKKVESVDKIMSTKQKHAILGKRVEIKRAYTKKETRAKLLEETTRKLYIIGIPKALCKNKMEVYFSKFGRVMDCRVFHNHQKGIEKGYGFILFSEKEALERAIALGKKHVVEGFKLECKQTLLKEDIEDHKKQVDEEPFKGAPNWVSSNKAEKAKQKPEPEKTEKKKKCRFGLRMRGLFRKRNKNKKSNRVIQNHESEENQAQGFKTAEKQKMRAEEVKADTPGFSHQPSIAKAEKHAEMLEGFTKPRPEPEKEQEEPRSRKDKNLEEYERADSGMARSKSSDQSRSQERRRSQRAKFSSKISSKSVSREKATNSHKSFYSCFHSPNKLPEFKHRLLNNIKHKKTGNRQENRFEEVNCSFDAQKQRKNSIKSTSWITSERTTLASSNRFSAENYDLLENERKHHYQKSLQNGNEGFFNGFTIENFHNVGSEIHDSNTGLLSHRQSGRSINLIFGDNSAQGTTKKSSGKESLRTTSCSSHHFVQPSEIFGGEPPHYEKNPAKHHNYGLPQHQAISERQNLDSFKAHNLNFGLDSTFINSCSFGQEQSNSDNRFFKSSLYCLGISQFDDFDRRANYQNAAEGLDCGQHDRMDGISRPCEEPSGTNEDLSDTDYGVLQVQKLIVE